MSVSVSVVISSWNQRDTLGLVLESFYFQNHLPIEVIVADDGSSDGTLDWLDSLGHFPFSLEYVTRNHLGYDLVGLNNLGASKASGDRLLFTNADVIHSPNSVSAHCLVAESVIAGGKIRGIGMPESQFLEVQDVRNFQRLDTIQRKNPSACNNEQWQKLDPNSNFYGVWSGNFSISRALFERLGGYNEEYRFLYGGEEADLICRFKELGGNVIWATGSVAYHLDHPSKEYRRLASGNKKYRSEWL